VQTSSISFSLSASQFLAMVPLAVVPWGGRRRAGKPAGKENVTRVPVGGPGLRAELVQQQKQKQKRLTNTTLPLFSFSRVFLFYSPSISNV